VRGRCQDVAVSSLSNKNIALLVLCHSPAYNNCQCSVIFM
jgi:hypothetical protein